MAIVKILVILFLGALSALGVQVVFSKKQRTGKNGGGGTASGIVKKENQKNHENN